MAGIYESPKTPPPQPYKPPPVVETPVTPTEPAKTDAELAAESRTQNLLRRSRGRLGTILTSFTGFLNPKQSEQTNGRKTLLGE